MNRPLFSVIVPVYNSEITLRNCVQSVLKQEFEDFELLLIDDGSTDSSGVICDEFADRDSRVRVWHKVNGGVSSARNLALDNVRGQWITFCDSDDWVNSNWLKLYTENLDNSDLICQGIRYDYSNLSSIEAKERMLGLDYSGDIEKGVHEMFINECLGYTVVKAFSSRIIQENNLRFNSSFNFKEDEEFVLRYLTYCKTMTSSKLCAYNYIYPDFELKYRDKYNMIKLYASMYKSSKLIFGGKISSVVYYYLDQYTKELIRTFKTSPSIITIKQYRDQVGSQVLSTKLFAFTKYTIFCDLTGVIAFIVLYIHSSLRYK